MSDSPDTIAVLVQKISDILAPLGERANTDNAEELIGLFRDMGIPLANPETVSKFEAAFHECQAAYEILRSYVGEKARLSLADIPLGIDAIQKCYRALLRLDGVALLVDDGGSTVSLSGIGTHLLAHLVEGYLRATHPSLLGFLVQLGVVEFGDPLADAPQARPTKLHLERLPRIVGDPQALVREILDWGQRSIRINELLRSLQQAVHGLGWPAILTRPDKLPVPRLGALSPGGLDLQLHIPFYLNEDGPGTIGLAIQPLQKVDGDFDGFVLFPYGHLAASQHFDIGSGWSLVVIASAESADVPGLVVRVGGLSLQSVGDIGNMVPNMSIRIALGTEGRRPPKALIRSAVGELTIGDVSLSGQVITRTEDLECLIELELNGAALRLSSNSVDGFLSSLLSKEGISVKADVVLGWSSQKGVYFRGGQGLDVSIPVRELHVGGVTFDHLHLALVPRDSEIGLSVATSVKARLGPVSVAVDRIGLEVRVNTQKADGNLGPLDFSVAVRSPVGASLAIETSVISGGGSLFFDPKKQEYAGMMQLELLNKIAVKAIGLITTRMPDGTKGFSILVILSAEGFPPIQLGLGFTLNGIGGLLGVNRSLQVDTLRAGLKSDALNGILFPRDPIKNATQIVTSLASVFPPTPNRSLFGPMAIIGWGTPVILRLELAIIIELPDPVRLSILGRLTVALPDEKNPLVRIRMDAIGVVDFDNGEVAIDATLYDSHILSFAITGDMALRLKWGKEPNFVLAIGGFHPRFSPPPQFPSLNRLSLSILDNKNARLRFESYLALTSNTVQFGARVDFYFADPVVGFTLQGFASFDVLFQLVPFQFVADIGAAVAIRFRGVDLIAIRLAMSLSGPAPWHARGRAEIKILFFSISVAFDLQFGDAIPPPAPEPIDVAFLVSSALQDLRNWSSELPADIRHMVTVRVPPAIDVFRVHPLATLSVRQRVAPLFREISRFGSSPISGETTFTVELLSADGKSSLPTPLLTEMFAPAQFEDLTDDDKFTRSSFESMVAGLRLGSNNFDFESSSAPVEMLMQFETLLVLPDQPSIKQQPYSITPEALGAAVQFSPAASTAHSQRGASRYAEFTRSPELVE